MNSPQIHDSSVRLAGVADAFYSTADIASAMSVPDRKVNKKTVQRTAEREQWPSRFDGYKWLFVPPARIADAIIAAPKTEPDVPAPEVKFSDLTHSDTAREKVLLREQAVLLFRSCKQFGVEVALQTAVAEAKLRWPALKLNNINSLRAWDKKYTLFGIDGLVEQKRGRVGRKAFAEDLTRGQILQVAADAIGHGNWKKNKIRGRMNFGKAVENLVANPTITGDARRWLHGNYARKNYIAPSVKKRALEFAAPLAAGYLQRGPKSTRLEGPWTERDYSDNSAAHVITADDMTANCYVWCEWSNERGFVLLRPQILAVMHVGSLSWLNARAIINARKLKDGQTTGTATYSTLDAFATLGDTLDQTGIFLDEYGQPDMTFLLEGGAWQGKDIIGHRILPDAEQRFGGLRSLGKNVKIIHTRGPRGKGMIEQGFNQLQYEADNVRGYCGRNEMLDCPEDTKKNLALVKSGAHPSQFFLHITDYRKHLENAMHNLNLTRSDGKICGGMTPLEKFQSLQLKTMVLPDKLKYFYRSAYAVEKITANGFGITRTVCGRKERFQYDHPALANFQGARVAGFWDENYPDADAVLYTIRNGGPDELICVAPRSTSPSAFGANAEELASESTRKSLKMSLIISQAKAIAPLMQRKFNTVVTTQKNAEVAEQIHAARVENGKRIQSRKTLRDFQGGAEVLLDASPSPGGEGRDEGERENISAVDAGAPRYATPPHPSLDESLDENGGPLPSPVSRLGEFSEIETAAENFSETDLSASALLD
jgi:hypothetical protein